MSRVLPASSAGFFPSSPQARLEPQAKLFLLPFCGKGQPPDSFLYHKELAFVKSWDCCMSYKAVQYWRFSMTPLDGVELERYSRQILLIGGRGQQVLKRASALIVGLGGLGSPAAFYLAAAGVGRLGLIDSERVELSNLHRQILHTTPELNQLKSESALARLRVLNPHIKLISCPQRLTSENALEILREYDVIVDGSDNFPTRYLVNDACVLLKKPNVHGSVLGFEGQVTVFTPGGPCYRCVYEKPPPPGTVASCAEAGVFPTAAGLVGLIQANEALKLLLGREPSLKGRLLLIDVRSLSFSEIALKRNPHCAVCGERPQMKALIDYEEFCGRR